MSRTTRVWIGAVLVALGLLAVALWWQRRAVEPPPTVAEAPIPAPVIASAPTAPAIRHPIEAASAPAGIEAETELAALLGREAVLAFLQPDDFAHRLAATVDNLDRLQVTPRLWPVRPMPGRFSVEVGGGGEVIAAANAARYAPFVRFVEGVDPAHAAATYRRLYPAFQRAYVELGYPKGYFNDRVVDVVDLLLATPEPAGPVGVHRPQLGSDAPAPVRPWLLYEFDDPALQSLTAGQKILLRMGVANERRLKAWLRTFRGHVAGMPAVR